MKKSIRLIAAAVAAIILCVSLASCGLFGKTLDGKYENESGTVTYEFDGKNVKITAPKASISALLGEKEVFEGTYEIDDDVITITLVDDDGEELDDDDSFYDGTFDFEEKENGDIVIGNTEYELVD